MSEIPLSVDLRAVTKTYGTNTVVHRMDLQIRKGEFFSFLGPSGCGKTTTLRMIGGFEQPTSGQILLDGVSIEGKPPHERNVNTVFQSYALFPHMSVLENVAFGLRMKGVAVAEAHERANQALKTVKLGELGARRPAQLSGGQRQRVALARAIVNRPSVLLLDEPLSALDLKLRRAMQIELKELQSSLGITFIFVTHDQEEALTISDRIAVMSHGYVEQIGTPEEIYERPRTKFVADFIGTTNFMSGDVQSSDERGLTLKTLHGLLKCAPCTTVSVGGPGVASVRPEKIVLSTTRGVQAENELEGTVHEVIYVGTSTHFIVTLSDGQRVTVMAQNGQQATKAARHGERVYLTFAGADCRPLER
ncbi:MAG: ABC transporter ATP-binding protein [Myxococcota bacterium]